MYSETGLLLSAVIALVATLLVLLWLRQRQQPARESVHEEPHPHAQASRLSVVGELTATIAHEINQPLGAILSNADAGEILLERADPPLGEVRRILSDIRRDAVRASEVIRHMRRLAKKRELELERLDANALVVEVVTLLDADARRRRIALAAAPAAAPAWVLGDRALLQQVLVNLVANAMDAIETLPVADGGRSSPGVIEVAVAGTDHGEVELQVVDDGPGIPVEHLGQLFDSFHTSKPHGMGLGLSISRSIAEAHGGWIRAENRPPGGASFRLTLPPHPDGQG